MHAEVDLLNAILLGESVAHFFHDLGGMVGGVAEFAAGDEGAVEDLGGGHGESWNCETLDLFDVVLDRQCSLQHRQQFKFLEN